MVKYDAVVSDGGGRLEDGSPTILSLLRLNKILELYRSKRTRKIVSAGGFYGSFGKNAYKFHLKDSGAEARRRWFISKGVDSKDIIIWPEGGDTICFAIASFKAIKKYNFKQIGLVTSVTHMPRCLWIFRRVFGKSYKVFPESAPDNNLLIKNEEKEYILEAKEFFRSLAIDIDYAKVNISQWHNDHKNFYSRMRKIYDRYHPPGKESEAYAGVR